MNPTVSVPSGLPTLAAGAHRPDSGEACVMEYVALLAGEPWTDRPTCTHWMLSLAARWVNDRVTDDERAGLVPLIGRLFGTGLQDDRRALQERVLSAPPRPVVRPPLGPRVPCRPSTSPAW